VTCHPKRRFLPNNELANEECEAVVKLLPLRCVLDQRAIRFIRIFLRQDADDDCIKDPAEKRKWLPPPLFKSFGFKPYKLKVDYRPEKLDTDALRNGAIVELVNLSPIDGMVLTLQQVEISEAVGFGDVVSAAASEWIADVCSTQLVKFLTNARPLEPFKTVGQGAGDLVVLPWDAFRNGESVKKALRAGAKSFSKAVVYEAFTVTSRATEYIADQISKLSVSAIGSNALPSRPLRAPRDLLDTTPHVIESITRGLQAANYKIVVLPYREYRRSGAKGAVASVLRGIPVAIAAPASGAVEAISYGMIGARNQLAPEVRKEEEANQRGLVHWER
jgi:autophagy-related protein 2